MNLVIRDASAGITQMTERDRPITTIVLHSTAGASAESTTRWFRTGRVTNRKGQRVRVPASYDYIVGCQQGSTEDGVVYKLKPIESHYAWHAGESVGPQGANVNEYSVGIAFAHLNNGREPYTQLAQEAVIALAAQLKVAIPTIRWITTHYLIAPRRKNDPFKFDFMEFAGRLNSHPKLQADPLRPWRPGSATKWNCGIEG